MNQRQLANRWGVSEACLERWRSEGGGPQSLKLRGRVLYRQVDIEAFEEGCLPAAPKASSRSVPCLPCRGAPKLGSKASLAD